MGIAWAETLSLGAWAPGRRRTERFPSRVLGSHVRFHEDGKRVWCLQEATTQGDFVFVSGPAECERTGDPSQRGGGLA